jgi:hypothetical protein
VSTTASAGPHGIGENRDRSRSRVVAGERRVQRGGGEERSRGDDVPGLFEEEAEIARSPDPERGVLGEMAPERREDRRIVDVGAHECRRALAVEHLVCRLPQQFLVAGEREVHVTSASR